MVQKKNSLEPINNSSLKKRNNPTLFKKAFFVLLLILLIVPQLVFTMTRKPKPDIILQNIEPQQKEEVVKQKSEEVKTNYGIVWQKEKDWKTITKEKEKFISLLKKRPKDINVISQLALLELYSENYSEAHKHFSNLNIIKSDKLHQYYEALSLSLTNPLEATKKWRLYFSASSYQPEEKVWISLGEEVLKTLNSQLVHQPEQFRGMILWFYSQHAYYTTYMLLELYDRYMPTVDKTAIDFEFINSTKANILIKLGFLEDGIFHIEKIKNPSDDQNRKLAVAYYFSKRYELAIKTFSKVKKGSKKNSIYYYYLSLSHLRLSNFDAYQKNAAMLRSKQKSLTMNVNSLGEKNALEVKKARLLFERLNKIFPVSS